MIDLSLVFLIFGAILVIDGLIVVLFPEWIRQFLRKVAKDKNAIIKLGIFEIVIALIIFLIGFLMK